MAKAPQGRGTGFKGGEKLEDCQGVVSRIAPKGRATEFFKIFDCRGYPDRKYLAVYTWVPWLLISRAEGATTRQPRATP